MSEAPEISGTVNGSDEAGRRPGGLRREMRRDFSGVVAVCLRDEAMEGRQDQMRRDRRGRQMRNALAAIEVPTLAASAGETGGAARTV